MRRLDRDCTGDKGLIMRCLAESQVLHLAAKCDGAPYIIPLCFGWEEVDGKTVFYIHKNRGGLFEELVKADPCVGFELDGRCSTWLDYEKKMCNMDYASIVGHGRIRVVGGEDERLHGMDLIMRQYGHGDFEYERRAMAAINIWALDVEELTMKATKGWREGNVVG